MEEKELNINEIVKIEKMAVIKQQLDKVESFIDEKVKDIPKTLKKIRGMSFVEQEDEKNDIKKYQQYLSNLQKQLEDKRKEIKKEINKPYEEFNEYYNNGVYAKLDNGIQQLKEVVNEIEALQRDEKELELREFYNQYYQANNIYITLPIERMNLNITLSASMKSLKEQIKNFIEKVGSDLKLIELEEYKDEILFEYQNTLDFAKSKMLVVNRHSAIDAIKNIQESKQEQEKQEEKVFKNVENALYELNENTGVYEILMPKEIIEDEDILKVTFTIETTKGNIIELKNWLKERGIKYE